MTLNIFLSIISHISIKFLHKEDKMSQHDDIIKKFETAEALRVVPSSLQRIIIVCKDFTGATDCTYTDWKGIERTDKGLSFYNPKDNSTQVLKQADGCLIMYAESEREKGKIGRAEKVQSYLKKHSDAVKTAAGIQELITYLNEHVLTPESDSDKIDLWDTTTDFIEKKIQNPPEEIEAGTVVVSAKKEEFMDAIYVEPGFEFQGEATASSQIAGEDGAYIIRVPEKEGFSYHMIQSAEFGKAYKVTISYEEASNLLRNKKPEERKRLLENEDIRNAVLSTGASVILYKVDGEEPKDDLSNVYIGVVERKSKQNPDGLGNFGGLAERTSEDELLEKIEKLLKEKKGNPISEEDARQIVLAELFDKKDDIIKIGDRYEITSDIEIIRENNVLREMKEELEDLGIEGIKLEKLFTKNDDGEITNTSTLKIPDKENPKEPIEIKASDLKYIKMKDVRDDNYITNIWNGDKSQKVYAINPCCHTCQDIYGLLEVLEKNKEEAKKDGEMAGFKKMDLITALTSYGNEALEGEFALRDGSDPKRSALRDYRYPHEYLGLWALASNLLNHDSEKLEQLAIRVQNAADHPISLKKIADAIGQSDEELAKTLGITVKEFDKIEKALTQTYSNKTTTQIMRNPPSPPGREI